MTALEVLVGKALRRFMGTNYGWVHLLNIHLLSLPFLGPVHALFNPAFTKTFADDTGGFADHAKDGMKGIPAVWLAEIVLKIFQEGFKFPRISIKDLAVSAFSKTISRPMGAQLYKYMPEGQAANMLLFEAILNKQATSARLYSKTPRLKLAADQDLANSSAQALAPNKEP